METPTFVRLALALSVLWTGPSLAGTPVTKTVNVSYGDLDLTKRLGANVLRARIKSAARLACAPEPDLRLVTAYADYSRCIKESEESALSTILPQGQRRTAIEGN